MAPGGSGSGGEARAGAEDAGAWRRRGGPGRSHRPALGVPDGAGMRDGPREVLEQTLGLGERTLHDPVRQLERVLHAARDLALGLWPECEAVGTWQAQGDGQTATAMAGA